MFTYYDWHLVRALALLVVLGLFILYAFLIGMWQDHKARRDAQHMTEQDTPLALQRKTLHSADHRVTNRQQAQREDRSLAGPERRVA